MARKVTIAILIALIVGLIGAFFVVDRLNKTPPPPRREEMARRLAELDRGCPGVARADGQKARGLCLSSETAFEECFWSFQAIVERYSAYAETSGATDRCKIYVQNLRQSRLHDAAQAAAEQRRSKGLFSPFRGAEPPDRRELDKRFRDMQHALGQPETGCQGLNQACTAEPGEAAGTKPRPRSE